MQYSTRMYFGSSDRLLIFLSTDHDLGSKKLLSIRYLSSLRYYNIICLEALPRHSTLLSSACVAPLSVVLGIVSTTRALTDEADSSRGGIGGSLSGIRPPIALAGAAPAATSVKTIGVRGDTPSITRRTCSNCRSVDCVGGSAGSLPNRSMVSYLPHRINLCVRRTKEDKTERQRKTVPHTPRKKWRHFVKRASRTHGLTVITQVVHPF